MASYLHVPLDPVTLLCFGTTAAACGLTVKAATAKAISAWVEAHSDAVRAVADGRVQSAPEPTSIPLHLADGSAGTNSGAREEG
jgi:hypothetical protein